MYIYICILVCIILYYIIHYILIVYTLHNFIIFYIRGTQKNLFVLTPFQSSRVHQFLPLVLFWVCFTIVAFSKSCRCPKKTPKPSTQSPRRGEVKVNASQWISSRVAIWMYENGHVRDWMGVPWRMSTLG